jgi:flavin reductase (DIM6/NTAB) family NADH-FMN oxidoreductase RutF
MRGKMFQTPTNKRKMGRQHLLNPRPAILVGTFLDDKPNFITVSWAGITSAEPPTMSIAIRNIRYSLKGIMQNMMFSVNVPSASMVKETDYCGTVSGSVYDKVKECNFKIFYGILKKAPLIEQCPINLECEVLQNISLGDHTVFIGKIVETYISEDCFTNGIPDIRKIDPLYFCKITDQSKGYYKLGEFIAKTGDI